MADKPTTPPIFFVRGVPEDIQAATKAAAKRHGTTIGYIVAEALRRQLAGMEGTLSNRLYAPAQSSVIQNADTPAEQFDMFTGAAPSPAAVDIERIVAAAAQALQVAAVTQERLDALETRLRSGPQVIPESLRPAVEALIKPPQPHPKSLTPEEDAEVWRLTEEGMGTRKIAQLLGFTRDQVVGAQRRRRREALAQSVQSVQDAKSAESTAPETHMEGA